jgi:hypothetical protein
VSDFREAWRGHSSVLNGGAPERRPGAWSAAKGHPPRFLSWRDRYARGLGGRTFARCRDRRGSRQRAHHSRDLRRVFSRCISRSLRCRAVARFPPSLQSREYLCSRPRVAPREVAPEICVRPGSYAPAVRRDDERQGRRRTFRAVLSGRDNDGPTEHFVVGPIAQSPLPDAVHASGRGLVCRIALAPVERRGSADSLAIVAERHLGVPLVLHGRLRRSREEVELLLQYPDAIR